MLPKDGNAIVVLSVSEIVEFEDASQNSSRNILFTKLPSPLSSFIAHIRG